MYELGNYEIVIISTGRNTFSARGRREAKSADARQRALAALVAGDVKSPDAGDMHFDLVALFVLQCLDD